MRTTIIDPALASFVVLCAALPALANASPNGKSGDDDEIKHDPEAVIVVHGSDPSAFKDPIVYGDTIVTQEQIDTYAAKFPVKTQRPWLELGRALYREGPYKPGADVWGSSNLLFPSVLVYGDWRTAAGYSDTGAAHIDRFATRLNLDVDVQLTATERIHAFVRPLDRNPARFTGFDFGGKFDGREDLLVDGNLETLFFEGDLGAMTGGPGVASIPIAAGKFPLLFQNGVWVEDAFTGLAISIPAKNSSTFDIANYDTTFFAGFDDVTTGASPTPGFDENDVTILGATTFIEAHEGYWELGYGYTFGSGPLSDIDYHNLTAAFSRRYGAKVSNSTRVILNIGQELAGPDTAEGVLVLFENSLITEKPYTVIPYLNAFAGFGTAQSLARDGGAGGVLKNTGINFEGDALTLFPSLDATGNDAIGAALGIEYLFDLDKQLVLEVAAQTDHGSDAKALGNEFGLGARAQLPLNNAWILRFDAMVGWRQDGSDIAGVRLELRWKF